MTRLRQAERDPLDYVFDLPLDAQLVAKLFQNDDAGVAPLLSIRGRGGMSDAGAHLIYFCDAASDCTCSRTWVRERAPSRWRREARLTSEPARRYRVPERGTIERESGPISCLFDPSTIGISGLQRRRDLPGGGTRMTREPVGLHGVWVNGLRVFDGMKYSPQPDGAGRVLRNFDS